MLSRTALGAACILAAAFGQAQAQAPLSAIDWLSDSLAMPAAIVPPAGQDDIAVSALPEDVTVTELGHPSPDAVGLFPVSVTGLPPDLWGSSSSLDLARRFRAERGDVLPALQDLLYKLLLAELEPPVDAGARPTLFLARIDTLLSLGAVEQADALLKRAGTHDPEIFRRRFDTALLLGTEDQVCQAMLNMPDLSPTYPTRIFCLARGGDWDTAAVTLETARALGVTSDADDMLLASFLDPEIADPSQLLPATSRPSPLVFRMMEAIGEPLPTANLPRAFAHADLNANAGWKAQIEAAERLARTGAIDPNRLLGLYTERRPAASGGVWDRAAVIQKLDAAITLRDAAAVGAALPEAWDAMASVELETALATLYGQPLADLPLEGATATLAYHLQLLSDQYETTALAHTPATAKDRLLRAIATGDLAGVTVSDPVEAAIVEGFSITGIPVRLRSLTDENRLGEAILRAMELFTEGSSGDLDQVSDALTFLRSVGLEDTARRAALQLLLLDRRG
ncbi:MAG: hypothetical protein WBN04_02660 [Paracoccaceae bacterium]